MFITLDQRFQIMKRYCLTSTEFDFILSVWCYQGSSYEEDEQYNCPSQPEFHDYLYDWFELHKDGANAAAILRQTIQSLISKKVLLSSTPLPSLGEDFDPSRIQFNKIFIKGFIKHSGILGQELFRLYPSYLEINGEHKSLKNISKYFDSLESFFFSYGKAINFDPETHKHVLTLLSKAKDLNLINEGILNFVISRQWETLEREMHDTGVMNVITLNTKTVNNG